MSIKNLLIYFCIVGLGYIFKILFVGYLSYYVFIIVILFPLLSFLLLLCYARKSHLSFESDHIFIYQNTASLICIKKETTSVGYCKIDILNSKYLLTKENNIIPFSYPHCGGIHLSIGKYKQYDILNMIYLKRESYSYIDITIFPQNIEYDFTYIQSTLPKKSEETYSLLQKGDDPTEIFDIHEYHEGDLLKNIHWKLSLKHQKLLIKDNALPMQHHISIQCSFYGDDDDNDLMFQYLNVFCLYLLKNQYIFILSNKVIENESQYLQVLSQLLWDKKDTYNYSKSLYSYLVDKNGIHCIRGGII